MEPIIWSFDENHILRRHYPKCGSACHVLLPGRSANATKTHAQRLGVPCLQRHGDRRDNPSLTQCAQLLGFDIGTVRRRLRVLGIVPTLDGRALTLSAGQFAKLRTDLLSRNTYRPPAPPKDWRARVAKAADAGTRCELSASTVAAMAADLRAAGVMA